MTAVVPPRPRPTVEEHRPITRRLALGGVALLLAAIPAALIHEFLGKLLAFCALGVSLAAVVGLLVETPRPKVWS
jgi:hypothetical protein